MASKPNDLPPKWQAELLMTGAILAIIADAPGVRTVAQECTEEGHIANSLEVDFDYMESLYRITIERIDDDAN